MTEQQIRNKELVEKYPFLLPRHWKTGDVDVDYDYTWTELDDMPDGWRNAFGEQMCNEILHCLEKADYVDQYRILQIKEKYGGLRWYDSGAPDSIYDELDSIIEKYTTMSERTCVVCGKPATVMSLGWICPYCDDCAKGVRDRFKKIEFEDITIEDNSV